MSKHYIAIPRLVFDVYLTEKGKDAYEAAESLIERGLPKNRRVKEKVSREELKGFDDILMTIGLCYYKKVGGK